MTALGRICDAIGGAWPFRPRPEREQAEALLRVVVKTSRTPALYGEGRLPDTFDGRFEAAVLNACLVLIRLRREPEARLAAQEFTDLLFRWFDSGLYEAGVGYQAVPKRMRALAGRFYGRLDAYAGAIDADDSAALAEALARNAARTTPDEWPFARPWAEQVLKLAKAQAGTDWASLKQAERCWTGLD